MEARRASDPSSRRGRRVRDTRRRFMRALAELSLESGYGSVTIDEIADRADLGRATFYTHFRDKGDLLSRMVEELREELGARIAAVAATDNVGFTGEALTALFEHAAAEPGIYRLVVRGTGDGGPLRDLLDEIARTIQELWAARAKEFAVQARVPLAVASWAWAGQTITLMLWWLETGMPYTATEMAGMTRDIALRGHLWAQGFALEDEPAVLRASNKQQE